MSSLDKITDELRRYRIRFGTERQMQEDVAAILEVNGFAFTPECRLSKRDRIDFYVGLPWIGVECKVDGGLPDVASQLLRYAESDEIMGLVLVTRCRRHSRGLPQDAIAGKPLRVVYVGGSQL